MARRIARRSQEQQLMKTWWVCAILALVFFGVSYAFASLAIDSGSLWYYALTIFFFAWAINRTVNGIRYGLDR